MMVWRSPPAPDSLRSGRLIVMEGIDGAGKTTQAKLLAAALEKAGGRAVFTAEPTHGPAGRRIRDATVRLDPLPEAALFTQDRREHVAQVIMPALRSGVYVVCDRYVHSSVAYQGARGVDVDALVRENLSFAPAPDLVILLTIPVDLALSRISTRTSSGPDYFESRVGLCAVDTLYRSLEDPMLHRLSGDGATDRIHKAVMSALRRALGGLP